MCKGGQAGGPALQWLALQVGTIIISSSTLTERIFLKIKEPQRHARKRGRAGRRASEAASGGSGGGRERRLCIQQHGLRGPSPFSCVHRGRGGLDQDLLGLPHGPGPIVVEHQGLAGRAPPLHHHRPHCGHDQSVWGRTNISSNRLTRSAAWLANLGLLYCSLRPSDSLRALFRRVPGGGWILLRTQQ
jgi:hypothetical protein